MELQLRAAAVVTVLFEPRLGRHRNISGEKTKHKKMKLLQPHLQHGDKT